MRRYNYRDYDVYTVVISNGNVSVSINVGTSAEAIRKEFLYGEALFDYLASEM